MKNLTHEELLRQLDYNPITGLFYWKSTNSKRVKVGDVAGTFKRKDGYVIIIINGTGHKAHRLAWFYVHGYDSEYSIDHFPDRNKHHNWISNLREASSQCQTRNQGDRKDNTSGVKGVSLNKRENKWKAYIEINQKRKHLGTFENFDEAVCTRLAGEQCVNWEESDPNSPAYQYVKKNIFKEVFV